MELQRRGLISNLEALPSEGIGAEERHNDAQAAEFASRRVSLDLAAREQDRLARMRAVSLKKESRR